MALNKSKGNMYPFVDWHWSPIKGKCKHECSYCSTLHTRAKKYYEGEPYLSEKELKTNLRTDSFIFVGSMADIWCNWIPDEWINKILQHCRKYNNKYLFQSKNPVRFLEFRQKLPDDIMLGTTIETNRFWLCSSNAQDTFNRHISMTLLNCLRIEKMVSIEPILDFDVDVLLYWITLIKPKLITIGADSCGHNLKEPSSEKIQELINELRKFTKVILKSNLSRLGRFE